MAALKTKTTTKIASPDLSGKTAAELAEMLDAEQVSLSAVADHIASRKKVRYPSRILLLAIEHKQSGAKEPVSQIMAQIMDTKRKESDAKKSMYKALSGLSAAATKTPPDTDAVDIMDRLGKFIRAA